MRPRTLPGRALWFAIRVCYAVGRQAYGETCRVILELDRAAAKRRGMP